MKLFPPQPKVDLYNEGFDGISAQLSRAEEGKQLSDLVDRIETPMVIAVDGPWGCGKTHFLKRWVGAHALENNGRARTIYFDAFASDYLEDPLVALTSAIVDRAPDAGKLKKLKAAALAAAKPISRVSLAFMTAGVSELTGPLLDKAVEGLSQEAGHAVDDFWKKEAGRRAAMDTFRQALIELTEENSGSEGNAQPLVLVIDELDRCRPDYALSLLEVVKHFFAVSNVHFVLGVNLKALGLSVQARYGAQIDPHEYLKRFLTITMPLLDEIASERNQTKIQLQYFEHLAEQMEFPVDFKGRISAQFKLLGHRGSLSLRDVEKLLSNFAILPLVGVSSRLLAGPREVSISLVFMRILAPTLFEKVSLGLVEIEDIRKFFGFSDHQLVRTEGREHLYSHDAYIIDGIWHYLISGGQQPALERESISNLFSHWDRSPEPIVDLVAGLRRDYLDRFVIAAN